MVASVENRSRHCSPTIRANIKIAEIDFKKVLLVQKVNIFDLLVLTFKVPNL